MGYDPAATTDRDLVRLRISDKGPGELIFADEEIDAFLTAEGTWRGAAALALETIATNEALTQKVIRILELQTDGAKLADALMKQADRLRDQTTDPDNEAGFDWAEMLLTPFNREEYAIRELVTYG